MRLRWGGLDDGVWLLRMKSWETAGSVCGEAARRTSHLLAIWSRELLHCAVLGPAAFNGIGWWTGDWAINLSSLLSNYSTYSRAEKTERLCQMPAASHNTQSQGRSFTIAAIWRGCKGVAHPKIIILSLFTHPLVFPNLNAVIFLWNRKVEVFEESLRRQQQFIVTTA